MASRKVPREGSRGAEQLAGGGYREGTLCAYPLMGTMIEVEVRGSKPPWVDPGLKLGGHWLHGAPEAVPDLEILPRFLHLPFLGFHCGLGTEAEPQSFPCAGVTEHLATSCGFPSSHSRWKLFSSLPDDRKGGLLEVQCLAAVALLRNLSQSPGP